jgi:hypothetical protein
MVGLGAILTKHNIQSHVYRPIGSAWRKGIVEGKGAGEVLVLRVAGSTRSML